MATNTSHERTLLFSGLGLQLSLLTKEHLVSAFSEWVVKKDLSLGEILVQQKTITPEQQKAIEGAVDAQIENDGGEVQALASVKNAQEIETCFKNIEDQELQMTLTVMHCLQSRKILGNEEENVTNAKPLGFNQPLPVKKPLEQRFQRKHFLDAGNLGEIWFAKDEELNRTVVLKYIKAEQQGNSFTKALFNLEGEVTGYLEHPGVVPVYGKGQDAKERSFYAMRYIQGRKLTRAIADYHAIPPSSIGKRREALTELLQIFQTACLAIEYAHSKGVLHCDLKPDNIVVGPFGETLVIDWGLAMVTNSKSEMAREIKNLEQIPNGTVSGEISGPYSPSPTAHPGLHSSQGGMRKFVGGTPAYMAPEQMRATRGGEVKDVTHSSDIFGLGAILYHLLVSRAPYFPNKDKREVYAEFIQRIEKGGFPQPRQLNPSISKPLEAIVLKAMAAKPQDRYASARELAEEVKRWLADEPVLAYRENVWEGTRRWARNNRTAVVAGLVLLNCLVIGGMCFAFMTERLNQNLDIKVRIATNAVLNYALLVEENPEIKNRKEMEPLRKTLLMEAMNCFKVLSFEFRRDKNPSKDWLQYLAEQLNRIGFLAAQIDDKYVAIFSFSEEITILEVLLKANPTNSGIQASLAGSHDELAKLFLEMNQQKETEASYQKAIPIREALVKAYPTNSRFQAALANLYNRLAILYSDTNRQKEAEASYQKALAIRETLVKANPINSEFQFDLAHSHNNLGFLYSKTNRQKEAEASYQKALGIYVSLLNANPTNSAFQAELTRTKNYLANLRNQQAWDLVSLPDKGDKDYQNGLLLVQEALTFNPQNGMIINTLGVAQYRVKQFSPALETLQQSNTINSKASGKEDPGDLAFLAMTCHHLNKKAEAETYFKKL